MLEYGGTVGKSLLSVGGLRSQGAGLAGYDGVVELDLCAGAETDTAFVLIGVVAYEGYVCKNWEMGAATSLLSLLSHSMRASHSPEI